MNNQLTETPNEELNTIVSNPKPRKTNTLSLSNSIKSVNPFSSINDTMKEFFEFKKRYFLKLKNLNCCGNSYFKFFIKPYLKYEEIKFINVSHKGSRKDILRIGTKSNSRKFTQRLNILNKLNEYLFTENALYTFPCEYMNVEGVIFGRLNVYTDFIVFESSDNFQDYQSKSEYLFSSLVHNFFI